VAAGAKWRNGSPVRVQEGIELVVLWLLEPRTQAEGNI